MVVSCILLLGTYHRCLIFFLEGGIKKLKGKVFDITKSRPKVLILGNGISKADGNKDWDKLINDLSQDGMKDVLLPNVTPYSIRATVVTDVDDKKRHSKYQEELSEKNHKYVDNEIMKELMKIPFDAVLTTNYTYEIEYVFDSRYPSMSDNLKRNKYATNLRSQRNKAFAGKGNKDARYLISTFNRIKNDNYPVQDIWHIHGEQRRKTSMILTHNEYIKLISKIVEYFDEIKNKYEKNATELEFISWLDYFVLGELYIVGQGFNFSEFDLWWLLGRRLRENVNAGNLPDIHFYSPKFYENEKNVAKAMEYFETELNVAKEKDEQNEKYDEMNEAYRLFYMGVVEDIKKN